MRHILTAQHRRRRLIGFTNIRNILRHVLRCQIRLAWREETILPLPKPKGIGLFNRLIFSMGILAGASMVGYHGAVLLWSFSA